MTSEERARAVLREYERRAAQEGRGMIKAGTLVLLTHGEYSDYSVLTLVRFTVDADPVALRGEFAAWKDAAPPHEYRSSYEFANWLVNVRKVADDVPHGEWWIGAYGELSTDPNDVRLPAPMAGEEGRETARPEYTPTPTTPEERAKWAFTTIWANAGMHHEDYFIEMVAQTIREAEAAARREGIAAAAEVADQCAADWREAYPRGKVAHHIVSTGAGAIAMKIRALT